MQIFRNQRHSETLTGENKLIGRSAKFDRAAAEPLKLPEVRIAHVDEGYCCRMNPPACDRSQTLQDNRNCELGVLHGQKPWNADDMHLDYQVTVPPRHLYADRVVYNAAITTKERYRFAKILRCGGYVEHQPQFSRIDLCSKVETERRIVERLSSKFKQPGLRGGRDAIFGVVQILF